ncbi:uncharacterized [Tachysurus ichikawai]
MCFFYGFSMMNYPWKELSRANTHQRVKEMVLGDWRTAAVKWNTTGWVTLAQSTGLVNAALNLLPLRRALCPHSPACLEEVLS